MGLRLKLKKHIKNNMIALALEKTRGEFIGIRYEFILIYVK